MSLYEVRFEADYVTKRREISDEVLELIKPVIEQIKLKKGHNWATSEYASGGTPEEVYLESGLVTEEQFGAFDYLVPYGEQGVHTIVSITILIVQDEIKLL